MHQFRTSRAHQTGKAQDLTFAEFDVDVRETVAGEILRTQNHFLRTGRFLGICLGQLTANHEADKILLIRILHIHSGDVLAVAENGDPVADLKEFLKTVGYVDNGNPCGLQLFHDLKQPLLLFHGDGSGGFVHDHHLGILYHGLGDLNDLAVGHGQLTDQGLGRNIAAEPLQQFPGLLRPGLVIHKGSLVILHAHEDVIHDGHGFHLDHFLINHSNTQINGLSGFQMGIAFSVYTDFTRCRMNGACDDFDKGGFSGAVLTHKRMYFAFLKGDGYIVQCGYAGIYFGNISKLQLHENASFRLFFYPVFV